jgi:hypothetical protein
MVLSIRVDEDSEVMDGALENEPRDLSPRVPLLKEWTDVSSRSTSIDGSGISMGPEAARVSPNTFRWSDSQKERLMARKLR